MSRTSKTPKTSKASKFAPSTSFPTKATQEVELSTDVADSQDIVADAPIDVVLLATTEATLEATLEAAIEDATEATTEATLEATPEVELSEVDKVQLLINKNIEDSTPVEVPIEEQEYDEVPNVCMLEKGDQFHLQNEFYTVLGYKEKTEKVALVKHRGCDKYPVEATVQSLNADYDAGNIVLFDAEEL